VLRGTRTSVAHQFVILIRRYLRKVRYCRMTVFGNSGLMLALGVMCGALHGPNPPVQVLVLYRMLFSAAFSCIVATTTLGSLGASALERELVAHEAACGVSQPAEALARLLVDIIVVVLPLAPLFSMPLAGLSVSHVGTGQAIVLHCAIGWAFTSLGYLCATLFPAASAMANIATSFLIAIFLAGPMGISPATLLATPGLEQPFANTTLTDGYGLFAVVPGFWSLTLNLLLTATNEPFAMGRTAILRQCVQFGILTDWRSGTVSAKEAEQLNYAYETSATRWWDAGMLSLLLFGAAVRLLTLALFTMRHWNLRSWRLHVSALGRELHRKLEAVVQRQQPEKAKDPKSS